MNDLISRQEAIDMSCGIAETAQEIEKIQAESADYLNGLNSCGIIDYSVYSTAFDYYTELIDKAYSLGKSESKQKWIPCSERFPEEEGWYLVTIQNDKTRKRRTENDLFAIGIAEAHKHTPYKFCKDGHRQTVIAWMPIPEPYKAESEEV